MANSSDIAKVAKAIRFLAADAIAKAESGHPGMPLGMAEIAATLWLKHLSFDAADPHWANRDRFVVSNGHGSMLLYALLHLFGYDLSIKDIKQFRQLHSKTAGHPELDIAYGIETTTGPLGQGLGNAVGLALAEKKSAAKQVADHHTYVLVGDGCLMEGVSHEVASLAGTWQLGKLIALYDDNGISIDGDTEAWMTDDTAARFKSYGWQVIEQVDGHNIEAIDQALVAAKANTTQPTLIMCQTTIGQGAADVAGTAKAHGESLTAESIANMREQLDWSHAPFEIPQAIYDIAKQAGAARKTAEPKPSDATKLTEAFANQTLQAVQQAMPDEATRKGSLRALNAFAPKVPGLIGGSADLTGSNKTFFEGASIWSVDQPKGNYLQFGVREFGMGAICNGLALYGGLKAFAGTFLVFSDYARNAIRMAALMKLPVTWVLTHDSIGLGEDGPTHQPIEHLGSLRLMPNLDVWRPCDSAECVVAWQAALTRETGPAALVLSRQSVSHQVRDETVLANIHRGGYVLDVADKPQCVLMATGSEVPLAMQAKQALAEQNVQASVVSMPCVEQFARQSEAYQQSVLPADVPRLIIEAGNPDTWYRYVGRRGHVMGIDNQFGVSAPGKQAMDHFGFSVEQVVKQTLQLIN